LSVLAFYSTNMGFTFSHPALIVPFKYFPRKYYSLSGLVIGSIIPDSEYFIRLNNVSKFSHTIPGIFWFDIPLGVLFLFLFHQVVRNKLIRNLGHSVQLRLHRYEAFNWPLYFKANWLVVLCSILIGTATHLFWDGFTSDNGYFVMLWPVLLKPIFFGGHSIRAYHIIKHLSSIAGGFVIIYQFFSLPQSTAPSKANKGWFWLVFSILFLCALMIQWMIHPTLTHYTILIKKIISSALLALIFTCLLSGRKKELKN
jgi:hypothetical protein